MKRLAFDPHDPLMFANGDYAEVIWVVHAHLGLTYLCCALV